MKLDTLVRCTLTAAVLLASAAARGAESTAAPAATAEAPASSAFSWLQMPKISMPTMTMPKVLKNPLEPIKGSAKKVGDGAKRAWEGTKEIFTFGEGKGAAEPAAGSATSNGMNGSSGASNAQPSFWKRMFGGGEPPEDEGAQTVAQFMAQPRPE